MYVVAKMAENSIEHPRTNGKSLKNEQPTEEDRISETNSDNAKMIKMKSSPSFYFNGKQERDEDVDDRSIFEEKEEEEQIKKPRKEGYTCRFDLEPQYIPYSISNFDSETVTQDYFVFKEPTSSAHNLQCFSQYSIQGEALINCTEERIEFLEKQLEEFHTQARELDSIKRRDENLNIIYPTQATICANRYSKYDDRKGNMFFKKFVKNLKGYYGNIATTCNSRNKAQKTYRRNNANIQFDNPHINGNRQISKSISKDNPTSSRDRTYWDDSLTTRKIKPEGHAKDCDCDHCSSEKKYIRKKPITDSEQENSSYMQNKEKNDHDENSSQDSISAVNKGLFNFDRFAYPTRSSCILCKNMLKYACACRRAYYGTNWNKEDPELVKHCEMLEAQIRPQDNANSYNKIFGLDVSGSDLGNDPDYNEPNCSTEDSKARCFDQNNSKHHYDSKPNYSRKDNDLDISERQRSGQSLNASCKITKIKPKKAKSRQAKVELPASRQQKTQSPVSKLSKKTFDKVRPGVLKINRKK